MDRQEAIAYVIGLQLKVNGEWAVGDAERQIWGERCEQALLALGVTREELGDG